MPRTAQIGYIKDLFKNKGLSLRKISWRTGHNFQLVRKDGLSGGLGRKAAAKLGSGRAARIWRSIFHTGKQFIGTGRHGNQCRIHARSLFQQQSPPLEQPDRLHKQFSLYPIPDQQGPNPFQRVPVRSPIAGIRFCHFPCPCAAGLYGIVFRHSICILYQASLANHFALYIFWMCSVCFLQRRSNTSRLSGSKTCPHNPDAGCRKCIRRDDSAGTPQVLCICRMERTQWNSEVIVVLLSHKLSVSAYPVHLRFPASAGN